MCLAVAAFGACFAADAAPAAIVLNGISHTVWVGKGASDSTVVIDSADAPSGSRQLFFGGDIHGLAASRTS
jgi:hypothetical protein